MIASTRRTLLAGLALPAAAVAHAVPVPAALLPGAAPHPDAGLFALGHELDAAWARERQAMEDGEDLPDAKADAIFEAAYGACSAIVSRIEEHVATTLDGLLVKARACSWCHSGEPFTGQSFDDRPTTDVRLAAGVLRDLLALAGGVA